MSEDQKEENKEVENDILKEKPGNPFERSQAEVDQEVKDAQSTDLNQQKNQVENNPTLETLTGGVPREAKMDRKQALKDFLKENRQQVKEKKKKNGKQDNAN